MKSMGLRIFGVIVCAVFIVTGSASSHAEAPVSKTDASVIVKSLDYVRGLRPDNGTLNVGIVYDPGNGASQQEAQVVYDLLKSMPQLEAGRLSPSLVSIHALGQHKSSQILYIARGLNDYYARIRDFSHTNHVFNISLDRGCADTGCCAVAVQTGSKVKIFLNVEAMENSGFDVDATFRYMAVRV